MSVDDGLRTAKTAVSAGSALGAGAWGSLRYRQPNESRLGSLREHVREKATSRSVCLQQLVTIMNGVCECVAGKPMAKSPGSIEIISTFMPIQDSPTNTYFYPSRDLVTCTQNFYLDRLIRPNLPAISSFGRYQGSFSPSMLRIPIGFEAERINEDPGFVPTGF